jgi:hypothetical protein
VSSSERLLQNGGLCEAAVFPLRFVPGRSERPTFWDDLAGGFFNQGRPVAEIARKHDCSPAIPLDIDQTPAI